MISFRQIAFALALLGVVMPLRADNPAAPNLANIRAQFAAKDATIVDLQRQVTERDARIADLQKQAANTFPTPLLSTSPAIQIGAAPADKAVQLSITAPSTPLPAVLALLSKQTGVSILADDTVQGTLGAMSVNQSGLEPALNQLKAAIPGLTWQKIYLPKDAPLPKGNALSRQVRDLKALTAATLTVTDPDTKSLLSLSQTKEDAAVSAPSGMQTVYLVTNEMVRARREAAQKAAEMAQQATAAPTAPIVAPGLTPPMPIQGGGGNVAQAVSGLQGASEMLGQMTPDEQRQALPLMFQQFGQMMQKIDPAVRREMFQQWQQQFRP